MDKKADYYGLLGVDRRASLDEIRAAFRKFALQFHPDRNPDEAGKKTFRRISEAYDILSNEETRKIYDQIGSEGLRGRTIRDYETEDYSTLDAFEDGLAMSVYEDVSRRRYNPKRLHDSPFGDWSGIGKGGRGANLRVDIEIGLEEAASGAWKTVDVIREELCGVCKGSGSKPGSKPVDCPRCQDFWTNRHKPELSRRKFRCPECGGRRKKIIIACDRCRGAGTLPTQRTLKIQVPPGSKDGDRIVLIGEGDQSFLGGRSGDLAVQIDIRKEARV